MGTQALDANTTGSANTALGRWALRLNTAGTNDTALGASAMDLTTGSSNTAVGHGALVANATGTCKIALGAGSGGVVATGSNNVSVQASAAAANEATTMRLGTSITRTFIDGIRGVATGVADAVAVVIDSNGRLGTVSSSRETKEAIADLGDGRVETVKYHVLPTLLLAEVQRLERDREAMARTIAAQAEALDQLRTAVDRLSRPQ